MRRAWAGAVLLLAALALAGSADAGGEVSELERTPHFLVVRVSGPFDEVMLLLQEAIKRRNYGITSINNLDDTLSRRAAETGGTGSPYQHYKVIGFCNLTLADDALRRHPYVGAFLPCRAAVYQSAGERSTTIVAAPGWSVGTTVTVESCERDGPSGSKFALGAAGESVVGSRWISSSSLLTTSDICWTRSSTFFATISLKRSLTPGGMSVRARERFGISSSRW